MLVVGESDLFQRGRVVEESTLGGTIDTGIAFPIYPALSTKPGEIQGCGVPPVTCAG